MTVDMLSSAKDSIVEDGLRTIVARTVRMEDRQDRITADTNLFEIGLESLSVVSLLTDIEVTFGIDIDVEDLSSGLFESFGTLCAFVQAKLGQG